MPGHQPRRGDRRALMNLYGKRWGIECGFRDTKDLRFGMGMGSIHVSTPDRRDRLWLVSAFAMALLTLLGAAGEALGYDRYLKSNTSKRRTHSLFRQGACSTNSSPTCRICGCGRWSSVSPKCSPTSRSLQMFRRRLKMRGVVRSAPPGNARNASLRSVRFCPA